MANKTHVAWRIFLCNLRKAIICVHKSNFLNRSTMLSKKQIQYLKQLHLKKNRKREGVFLAEGVKIIDDLLASNLEIHAVYTTEEHIEWLNAIPRDIEIQLCSSNDFSRFSYLKSPDGIAAVATIPKYSVKSEYHKFIALEDVNDPGNLGTLLRSSDWFGMDAVLISQNTTDPYSPKAVQAAKGSLFRLPVIQLDLQNELKKLRDMGFSVYAMEMEGRDIHDVVPNPKSVILLGSEANGLKTKTLAMATDRIRIDRVNSESPIDSLNVGIAGSIAMFALSRGSD
jgi:TrmH family RNA methyltransferase